MATIDQIGYRKITKNEEAAKEVVGYRGIAQFQDGAAPPSGSYKIYLQYYRQLMAS